MVKCDFCGEGIDYLPFKCRYCGKTHCKIHRIPEKHACTFEFKSAETLTNPSKATSKRKYYAQPHRSSVRLPRSIRSNQFQTRTMPSFGSVGQMSGVKILLILNVTFFILTVFQPLRQYILLGLGNILEAPYLFYTVFTSMFIPTELSNLYALINLLFFLIMIFFIGRNIEMSFGRKVFLSIYAIGALITSGSILLIQMLLSVIGLPQFSTNLYFSSMGGVLALITFMGMLNPETQVTFYLYFIPIRLKMKHIVLIFIGFQLFYFIVFSQYVIAPANIAGCLGGIIMVRSIRQRSTPMFR